MQPGHTRRDDLLHFRIVSGRPKSVNEQMTNLASQFERTRQKIEVAGLSQARRQVTFLEERRRLSGVAHQSAQNPSGQKNCGRGCARFSTKKMRAACSSLQVVTDKLAVLAPVDAAAIRDEYLDLLEKRQIFRSHGTGRPELPGPGVILICIGAIARAHR